MSRGLDPGKGEDPAHGCRRLRRLTMRHWITSFQLVDDESRFKPKNLTRKDIDTAVAVIRRCCGSMVSAPGPRAFARFSLNRARPTRLLVRKSGRDARGPRVFKPSGCKRRPADGCAARRRAP